MVLYKDQGCIFISTEYIKVVLLFTNLRRLKLVQHYLVYISWSRKIMLGGISSKPRSQANTVRWLRYNCIWEFLRLYSEQHANSKQNYVHNSHYLSYSKGRSYRSNILGSQALSTISAQQREIKSASIYLSSSLWVYKG
jgi:hypothetical protein